MLAQLKEANARSDALAADLSTLRCGKFLEHILLVQSRVSACHASASRDTRIWPPSHTPMHAVHVTLMSLLYTNHSDDHHTHPTILYVARAARSTDLAHTRRATTTTHTHLAHTRHVTILVAAQQQSSPQSRNRQVRAVIAPFLTRQQAPCFPNETCLAQIHTNGVNLTYA